MHQRKWKEGFMTMVDKLQADPRIRVTQAVFNPPAPLEDMEFAKEQCHGVLPEGCQSFYEAMNGLTIEWHMNEPNPISNDRGTIRILPIRQVFGSWQGATWFPEPRPDTKYQAVKPFDHFVTEACAAFKVRPQKPAESTVYFHYFGEASVNTRYSFTEYLERLLVSRGYWYWIQALSRETADNPEAKAFRQGASRLFDDYEDTWFVPK
ncbi:hypothetical protein [Paenibacillus aestuarii]|uniref:SMI1/KNR4 family protein n=1 Tax=Paenibacillus aestuarii TaxID=516965 RepID=A0ABW0K920_9BACL|nr:hypothetical protein [Paenibacillus aestuarii]